MTRTCNRNLFTCVLAFALTVLMLSCSLDPNARKMKHFQNGQRYEEKGKPREASVQFQKAIKIDPNFTEAHRKLAETYIQLEQPARAADEYKEVVRVRPNDYDARIKMTHMLVASHKYPEAEEQANILLIRQPNDPGVHSLAAEVFAAEGNIKAAITQTQKTIALAPGRWELFVSLALLQIKNNEPSAAEVSLKTVVQLAPKAVEARLLIGEFYASQKRFADAETQYRAAMAMDAHNIRVREGLARLFLAEGKNSAAEEVLIQSRREIQDNPQTLLDLSSFYYVTGDISKAVAEYDEFYKNHADDIQVKKKYIQLLIQVKRYADARRLNEEILKSTPNDSDALLYRSQMQISEGHAGDAMQTLMNVIKNSPGNSEAHYALGVAFEKQGSSERAVSEWEETLRINPNSFDAAQAIANQALKRGDMRALHAAALRLVKITPSSPDGYGLCALASINLKQFDMAETEARKAIEVAPRNAFGYTQLGNLRSMQKRNGEAIDAYKNALERNPNSMDSLRGIVNSYMAEKQLDKAITTVNAQIAKSPNNSNFYAFLGDLLFHGKGDLTGTITALKQATAKDPHNTAAWANLCEVLSSKGQLNQAISASSMAIKANQGHSELYTLQGRLYEANSEWKNAQQAYQNTLAISAQDPMASTGLARTMLYTGGNLDTALSLVQAAQKNLAGSPEIFDTMGWIYYQKGVYQLALNCFQEGINLIQSKKLRDDPDLHYHLGMTYLKMQRIQQAREQLTRTLASYPEYREANQIKQLLAKMK